MSGVVMGELEFKYLSPGLEFEQKFDEDLSSVFGVMGFLERRFLVRVRLWKSCV